MNKTYTILLLTSLIIIIEITAGISIYSAGQDVYQQKCARCHSLRVPDNYTRDEWKYNVERMAQRAGLTAQEVLIITELNKKK